MDINTQELFYSKSINPLDVEEIDRKLIGLARKNYVPDREIAYSYGSSGDKAGIAGLQGTNSQTQVPIFPIQSLKKGYKYGMEGNDSLADAYMAGTGQVPYKNARDIRHDQFRNIHTHPDLLEYDGKTIDITQARKPPSAMDMFANSALRGTPMNFDLPEDNYNLVHTMEENLPVTYKYAAKNSIATKINPYMKAAEKATNPIAEQWYNSRALDQMRVAQNRYTNLEKGTNTIAAIRAKANGLLNPGSDYIQDLFKYRGEMLPKAYELHGDYVKRIV